MGKHSKIFLIIFLTIIFIVYGFIAAYGFSKINQWRVKESDKLLIESQKTDNQKRSFTFLQQAALINPNEKTYLMAGVKAQEIGLENISVYYLKKVKTAGGFMELGNLYFDDEKYDLAEIAYKKSLDKQENSDIWLLLGKNYLKKSQIKEATYSFEQAVREDSHNPEIKYYQVITYLLSENEKYKALAGELSENYKAEIEKIVLSPNKTTRTNRLFSYLKGHSYPQLAFAYLESKIGTSSLDRDGHLLLANEYFLRKDYPTSFQLLLKAKEIDPYYPQTYQHLIEVAKKLGKNNEAKDYQDFLNLISWQ